MAKNQPKFLMQTDIRELVDVLKQFKCLGPDILGKVESMAFMAIEHRKYKLSLRKYGKRRRDSGMGLKKILTVAEQGQLKSYLEEKAAYGGLAEKKDFLMFDMLICSGLRVSELCHLRLKDCPVVLGEKILSVYRGKNNKDRDIAISDRLAAAITNYVTKHRPKTLPAGVRNNDITKPVFYSRIRTQCTGQAIYKRLKKLAKRAGISKPVTVHMMRHTAITNWLLADINLGIIQRMAGHSSITVTEKYVHLVELLDRTVGNRADTWFLTQK